ncbi:MULTISPECIES: MFS transporter [unclassified Polaribacter]|uniref:MFS transporter n=1 Tax=unclassified Polaribacter TaxID=196858 RepID=UPI0011BE14F0|nr:MULTISPECIES: MFS transporter [unclassified Polaribacter]TXD51937.1 MFS transporter [Polaribacter sp. IC063]TXD59719.1 MFS transporter [Polaribacter sp. IC066]
MSNNQTSSSKVPLGQKIAFGLGMLANQMFPAAMGIFMVVLIQDYGFSTSLWGILFFLPRIFDSITDPIMGFISDNTRSIWGRRKQYVLLGAIIMGVSFALLWQLYVDNGVTYNFIYFLGWSLAFYLGLTIFGVPYVAMGYEMSDDFHERTNIMATAQWIGQWAWVIAPWFWVVMYDEDWFGDTTETTRTLGVWVAVICAILAMVPAFFIKSKSTIDDESLTPLTIKTIGGSLKQIVENFKEAFKIEQFRKLCFSTFLIFNAFNVVAGFSFFIVVYYLFNGDAGAAGLWPTLLGSIGALATTFLVIPIVARMSKTIGKKKAFIVSQGISVLGYVMLWFLFIPGKPYMFLFALPFFSFGIGSLFTLMMSMTSDVIDIDELNTGKRREGVFGAIYWLMVKFGFAIAGLLTGAIMSLVGFVPDTINTEASITGIRLFYSGLPIVGTLVAMWIMRDYSLTEERALEISAELARRKEIRNAPTTSSGYGAGNLFPLANTITLKEYAGVNLSNLDEIAITSLFAKTLHNGLRGLCFSPYVEGQDANDVLSELQISRRMDIINPYTESVRSFSCTNGNELIPQIAKQKGLKTLVGAWISSDKKRNEKEIEGLIRLAKSGFVDIAAVGNEVLLRGDLSEKEVIAYIIRVKHELKDFNIPVGYVDTYYEYSKRPKLVEISDIILTNCYPFWEGSSIENSLIQLRQIHAITLKAANGKRIIITETGWPSQGEAVQKADPTKLNAMKYFIQTQEWANKEGVEMFHFSSFDESWKVKTEGELGARWGIWDKDEKLKYNS